MAVHVGDRIGEGEPELIFQLLAIGWGWAACRGRGRAAKAARRILFGGAGAAQYSNRPVRKKESMSTATRPANSMPACVSDTVTCAWLPGCLVSETPISVSLASPGTITDPKRLLSPAS